MPLRLIGYWKESLSDEYPFPQEVEADLAPALRARVVAYLESGALLANYRGLSWCRYRCEAPNGNRELSDGIWAWPEGLAHYVQEHRVGVPPEFVEHVCTTRADPSRYVPEAGTHRDLDDSLWLHWAQNHPRTPKLNALLAEAREHTTAKCEEELQAKGADAERERGIGFDACARAGCLWRAMSGVAFCGRCSIEHTRDWTLLRLEYHALRDIVDRAPWTDDAPA